MIGSETHMLTVETRPQTGDELEPISLDLDGEHQRVLGIDDRWHDAQARYFKVATDVGYLHLLRYDLETQLWSLVRSWQLDA